MDNTKVTPEFLQLIGNMIESITGDRNETGFALFIIPTNENKPEIKYVANVQRLDLMNGLNNWLNQQKIKAN